jgi:putative addiction module antidote
MSVVKLTQIGNSVGVILPKDVLARLNLQKGDSLYMSDAANGITLSTYDPEFELQMAQARRIRKKRRAVLHELAK